MSTKINFTRHPNQNPFPGLNLNFKFSLPEALGRCASEEQILQEKLRTVPKNSLDKLHPKNSETQPFVEYIDEGIWKNRISFHKDPNFSVLQTKAKAERSASFSDLDALCEAELKRRFPNYTLIQGFKAHIKNKFPSLARLIMGTDHFYREFTQKEVDKFKKQIAYSACNRDDMKCCPTIEDPFLRRKLNLREDSLLQTDHIFAKNSPMNGQRFIQEGQIVHLSQAIACSSDRKVENTGNLRVVQGKDKESICYTGRADSDLKALEQASFIFLNEIKTKRKGITQTHDERGNTIYQLDYVANSMLSIPWIWSTESPIAPFPEREYIENEREAFNKLKESGPITIEDPNVPGQKYQVKFNPILFSRSSNIFTRFENWLPPFFTGMSRAQEISQSGYVTLKALAEQKLASCASEEQKIQGIQSCLKTLDEHQMRYHLRPEEELLVRDYLCKLLNLPTIYHCKSSTDRTSVANALSSSLKQWIELKLPLPSHLPDLIKDECFKELFAANWMAGHQITRYARGGEGTVCGQRLNNENLGLSLSRGISQNPTIAHLLPARYLTDFPTSKKLKSGAFYLLALLPLTLFFYIPLTAITAVRHLGYAATLGRNPHWIGPKKFTLPMTPLTLIFNFPSIFPEKVLNENSPQVGARRLIAGGKNGGQTDDK